jgi:hypothetical protein
MGAIKLPHASGNSMSIAAPATNPASDLELKLPATVGTAGQVLKNSSTAGTLEFGAGGLFSSYAIIEDQKAHDTHGGTFTQDAWRTRDLNTEVADPDSIVSISSNQFTLQAGTYLLRWSAPARDLTHHQTRMYNITDSAVVRHGSSEYTNSMDVQNRSVGSARVTIAGAKAFELQHYGHNTTSTTGFGCAANSDGATEHYALVEIYKEA